MCMQSPGLVIVNGLLSHAVVKWVDLPYKLKGHWSFNKAGAKLIVAQLNKFILFCYVTEALIGLGLDNMGLYSSKLPIQVT